MKLETINKYLEPYLDVDTLRVSALSLLGFSAIMFSAAVILIPHGKTIPITKTLSIDKHLPVGALSQTDIDKTPPPLSPAEDSVAGLHASTPYGFAPIKAADGTTIFDAYRQKFVPSSPDKNLKSLVFFDVGLSETLTTTAINSLPAGTNLILSPYAANAQKTISAARSKGFEVWLFVPLEPKNFAENDTGPRTLLTNVSLEDNEKNLLSMLSMATGYTGIITNADNIFSKNEAAYKQFVEILSARGIKNIEADISAVDFITPSDDTNIILAPLSQHSIKQGVEWARTLSASSELAPLSAQVK